MKIQIEKRISERKALVLETANKDLINTGRRNSQLIK